MYLIYEADLSMGEIVILNNNVEELFSEFLIFLYIINRFTSKTIDTTKAIGVMIKNIGPNDIQNSATIDA